MDLAGAVASVVDDLRAAGIRASADLRDLNPPAVYVPPPQLAFRFGKLTADAAWTIAAVVPAVGRRQSLELLGPLIAAVCEVLPQITDARPVDLTGVDQSGPAPAYELSFTSRI